MHVEEFHLNLPSKDLKGSLQFYTEGLHFTKVFDFPQYCTLSLERFWLSFVPADGGCMPVRRNGGGWLFSVQLDDIHGYFERVRATGRVRFEQELELMQPGVWQFSVIDNNGYYVGFSMPTRPA
jgi:predicted enzyme related to lactoylglutathione lyase